MKLSIASHAAARMALRHVTEAMILETIENPERRKMGYEERNIAYRKYGRYYLKVVYITGGDTYRIITVIVQSEI